AGKILGINPFDEPNVTEAKENTAKLLAYYQEHGSLPATEKTVSEGDASVYVDDKTLHVLKDFCQQHNFNCGEMTGLLAAMMSSTRANDYFALLAYVPATNEINATLEEIRRRLRHVTRRAVTVGYGPRFQHSTGQ